MPLSHPSNHVFEFTPESLKPWCEARGMPGFRAKQILEWVYQKGVIDPADMTSLSKRDRDMLAEEMVFLSGDVVSHKTATDGVQKLLVQWRAAGSERRGSVVAGGGASVALGILGEPAATAASGELDSSRQTECVMIPAEDRRTACISSQIGCPVGCRFCASGLGGLDGNLSAGRIVEQVWLLGQLTDPKGVPLGRVSNVVFMGMGEPLANFAAVTNAIRTMNSLWGPGGGISARKITISTVGLPQAIERLASEFELPVTLALSLHAPNDEIRRKLIPWAEYTTIADLLGACRRWFEKTGREITLEYTLLRGVNDQPEHAEQLAVVARTLRANINLIRYNEVSGVPFGRPADEDVLAFQGILRERGANVHIRASRGRDIAAACGQLRHEHKAGTAVTGS